MIQEPRSEFQSPLSWPVVDNLVTYGTAMGGHAKELGIHAPGVVILNAPFVEPGQSATMVVPALAGPPVTGKVSFVAPTLDEKTRTLRARLERRP